VLLIALTEADSTLNLRSLQINSAECRFFTFFFFFLRKQGVPLDMNQTMERHTDAVYASFSYFF